MHHNVSVWPKSQFGEIFSKEFTKWIRGRMANTSKANIYRDMSGIYHILPSIFLNCYGYQNILKYISKAQHNQSL